MNRLYEKMKDDEWFKSKLNINNSKNCLNITFNEYLRLEYWEGNYKSASDEGLFVLNDNLTHYHIMDDEEAIQLVTELANGEVIFIEGGLLPGRFKVMTKEKFEKKKERYMKKKSFRIYTGNAIIKKST